MPARDYIIAVTGLTNQVWICKPSKKTPGTMTSDRVKVDREHFIDVLLQWLRGEIDENSNTLIIEEDGKKIAELKINRLALGVKSGKVDSPVLPTSAQEVNRSIATFLNWKVLSENVVESPDGWAYPIRSLNYEKSWGDLIAAYAKWHKWADNSFGEDNKIAIDIMEDFEFGIANNSIAHCFRQVGRAMQFYQEIMLKRESELNGANATAEE